METHQFVVSTFHCAGIFMCCRRILKSFKTNDKGALHTTHPIYIRKKKHEKNRQQIALNNFRSPEEHSQ